MLHISWYANKFGFVILESENTLWQMLLHRVMKFWTFENFYLWLFFVLF